MEKKKEIIQNKEQEINKLKDILKKKEEQQNNLVSAPISFTPNNFENIIDQNFFVEIEKIKNLLKSSQIEEISNFDNLLSLNETNLKIMNELKKICQNEIKEKFKILIEKIDIQIEKIKNNINSISSVFDEVKGKLSDKNIIPENVSNESIFPLQKYIDDQTKKVEKIKEIKDEIYKIYLQLTTSNKPESNNNKKDG